MNSSTVLFMLDCNHSHVNTFEQVEGINVIQIMLILIHTLWNANINESMSCVRYFYPFVFLFIYKMMKVYCHTRFWKANRMRTMYVAASETHIHNDYIIGHHHTLLNENSGNVLYYNNMSKISTESIT
jgi:hypothetical protein